jgi:hypothetical protein
MREGGGRFIAKLSHTLYLLFKTLLLIVWVVVTRQDKASKETFFLIHLIF